MSSLMKLNLSEILMHFTTKIMIQHNGIVCKEVGNIFYGKLLEYIYILIFI